VGAQQDLLEVWHEPTAILVGVAGEGGFGAISEDDKEVLLDWAAPLREMIPVLQRVFTKNLRPPEEFSIQYRQRDGSNSAGLL
jgi:hypothetical protein